MSFRDLFKLSSCIWFDLEQPRRNAVCSIISGSLFFTGWWLLIDANVNNETSMSTWYYVWGILGTISLLMVNTSDEDSGYGNDMSNWTSTKLFAAFVLGFASVIASIWIFLTDFKDKNKIPGVELLLQNIMILFSSLVFKFGRDRTNI